MSAEADHHCLLLAAGNAGEPAPPPKATGGPNAGAIIGGDDSRCSGTAVRCTHHRSLDELCADQAIKLTEYCRCRGAGRPGGGGPDCRSRCARQALPRQQGPGQHFCSGLGAARATRYLNTPRHATNCAPVLSCSVPVAARHIGKLRLSACCSKRLLTTSWPCACNSGTHARSLRAGLVARGDARRHARAGGRS
jgi:hypothetical protein